MSVNGVARVERDLQMRGGIGYGEGYLVEVQRATVDRYGIGGMKVGIAETWLRALFSGG